MVLDGTRSSILRSTNFLDRSSPMVNNISSPPFVENSQFATGQQQSSSSRPTANLNADQLELGARLVDVCQQNDKMVNDLKWKLKLQRLDIPTSSGLADTDYPNLEAFGLSDVSEFSLVRRFPMPQELVDQFSHMQCNCSMGIFPEISRAWVTVDSDLFAWNYETGTDLAYLDGLPTTILCMGLARPKPGVFQNHIHYLLCVATAVDVVLLAVSFSDQNGQPITNLREATTAEMHLLPDPLFRVPLDGAIISDITSTADGRLFLAARDGCLYELEYQDRGWFRRQCKKINHSKGLMSYLVPSFVSFTFGKDEPLAQVVVDETRHILFTRSENGSIQLFDLGPCGDHCSKVGSMSNSAIEHYASSICQTIEPSNFRRIVHMSPIESTESSVINLVAVTESGVRLYFTCYSSASYDQPIQDQRYGDQVEQWPQQLPTQSQQHARPTCLRLVHVRLPPGFTAGSLVARPNKVHLSYTNKDISLFVSAVDDDNDVLWSFSGSNFPFQQDLMETFMQLPTRGRTWSIVGSKSTNLNVAYEAAWIRQSPDLVVGVRPPLTVSQHMEVARKIVILTGQGIQIFERMRPVDLLQQILVEYGPESIQTRGFFSLHQPDQACAMCLILVCSTTLQNRHVIAERAIRAFFMYGGEPQIQMSSIQGAFETPITPTFQQGQFAEFTSLRSPIQASTPYQQQQSMIGRAPQTLTIPQPQMTPIHQPIQQPEVRYSSRHNGLYLYLGRTLGLLWNMNMTVEQLNVTDKNLPSILNSAFTTEELVWFLDQIQSLRDFLGSHSVIPSPILSNPALHGKNETARRQLAEAVNSERQSLLRYCELVDRSSEILGLWKLLTDHQFHVVVAQLPVDLQRVLKSVTFKQLVVQGKELCSDLITCLIRQYLGDHATTDAISERLRRICPNLYTTDDATVAKASELLQSARSIEDGDQRRQLLTESLTLYQKVAHQIHLPTVCLQLQDAHYFEGILELVLCAVNRLDPQQLSLTYYKDKDVVQPQSDESTQLRQIFLARMACYKCLTDALDKLMTAGGPSSDPRLSPQMAEVIGEQILRTVLQSKDELCHVAIFDWILDRNLNEKLIQIDSPFFESYLHNRVSEGGPQTLRHLDLLWKYYEKQAKYLQAATLLVKLAETHNVSMDLKQRLAYLSQAIMCAKSAPEAATSEAEFVQELEDKLEVGRLQCQIVDALRQLRHQDAGYVRDAIGRLNAELLDVTQLYADYAEAFGLPQCKLAIIHCAGHYESALIESLWKEIVDRELTLNQHESVDNRQKRLLFKLSSLAKLYSSAARYFPALYLIGLLQRKALENNFSANWMVKVGRSLGVGADDLLECLNTMYKSGDPVWRTNRKAQIFIVNTIASIILHFADTAMTLPVTKRQKITTRCLDVIAIYLIELQSLPTASPEISTLKQDFHSSQLKLERMSANN